MIHAVKYLIDTGKIYGVVKLYKSKWQIMIKTFIANRKSMKENADIC